MKIKKHYTKLDHYTVLVISHGLENGFRCVC